jgi:hypothetical protein
MKRAQLSFDGRLAFGFAAVLLAALGAAGCGSSAGVSGRSSPEDAGGSGKATHPKDAAVSALNPDGRAGEASVDGGFCSATGPVVQLPGSQGSYTVCTSQIAGTLFQSALCTCDSASVAGYLRTSGFNSLGQQGSNTPVGSPVGINNSYKISAGYTEIGGSFAVAGTDSVSFIGYLEAYGDMRLAGSAIVPGYTKAHRNGWLVGDFTDIGPADFEGDLHHQGSVTAVPLSVGGTNSSGSVTVSPPCPCGPKDILDVAAIVAQGKASNDNAAIGLDPGAWTNVITIDTVTLPCGSYYLNSIQIGGSLTLQVTGRVALYVGADITVIGELQVQLSSAAEIDIFIQNDLNLVGYALFGDKSRPAATRIYVGGSGSVNLVGAGGFVGNLYAPSSQVTAPGYLDVYGAVFSNDFLIPGYADFDYDEAITQVGTNCPPPKIPGQCSQCGSCTNGMACVGGACGACTQDTDCCGQSVCENGVCTVLIAK